MLRELLFFLTSILLVSRPAPTGQEDETRWLIHQVAISERYIVFSYAGDLWRVARAGGAAQRLTEGLLEDAFPAISPDGLHVAFSRRGGDDWDVFTIPMLGGEVTQLTFNPEADLVRAWSPDGLTVLFTSHRDEEGVFRLYSIPRGGSFPTALPLPRAWEGSMAPDGQRIAYVPFALPTDLGNSKWHHYRGGHAARIWIAELDDSKIEKLPRTESSDRFPVWVGELVYFVSDRAGANNLFVYDPRTRDVQQVTDFEDHGISHASGGAGTIAFVQDGRIGTFNTTSAEVQFPEVEIEPGAEELGPRSVEGANFIQSASPSAAAERVAFGVRGDVVLFDVAAGTSRNLTRTSGVAERDAVLSPDGKWVAYFSDESGAYQLHIRSLADSSVIKIRVALKPSFYRELTWSPNSRFLAFSDKRLSLWVADVETGGASRIATSSYSDQDLWHPAWSPDGVWLAYSKYESNRLRAIYVYHADRGRTRRITDGKTHAEHPIFDAGGKYLYFIASNTAALGEFGWSVLSGLLYRPLVSRRVQMVLLRDGAPAPFFPVTGEPNPAADSIAAEAETAGGERRRPAGPAPGRGPAGGTFINLADITQRIVPVPLPPKDYAGLIPGTAGELFVVVNSWPDSPALGNSPSRIFYRYTLSEPRKLEKLLEDVRAVHVSADRRAILYQTGRDWRIRSLTSDSAANDEQLDLSSIEIEVDPREEWQQIYHEAWRLMDDYFYDPNHHGQNPAELEAHYAAYLPQITRRSDLNTLLGHALGRISVSHLAIRGGDVAVEEAHSSRIGLLGADYEIDRGRYRFRRIYRAGHYNDGVSLLQAPLDQPGIEVSEGDYLLSVDGVQIRAERNVYSYFTHTAGRTVTIEVGPEADGEDSRTYRVVPIPGENTLRRINWAERNRQVVDSLSNGVLGYVYVRNFSSGLEMVFRQLLGNSDKRGLVIDQRFAGGGITSDYLIEMLRRTPIYYYMFREGDDLAVPTNPLPRAKVLVINDVNASAAETFALMYKLANVGPIIGVRTWGAGIGPYVYVPPLIDGGRVSIPNRAAFDPAGKWGIENDGVEPDIEVEWLPVDWRKGSDPQLEAAVRAALQDLVDHPPVEIKRPEYPIHPRGSDQAES